MCTLLDRPIWWIVGYMYYKLYYIHSVLKIYTHLNCPLGSHFLFFFRIYEIDIENYVRSFISKIFFMSPYINIFEYHINIVVHRMYVLLNQLWIRIRFVFPRDITGFRQQRKQFTGISGTFAKHSRCWSIFEATINDLKQKYFLKVNTIAQSPWYLTFPYLPLEVSRRNFPATN
jgi:hypothetical protein